MQPESWLECIMSSLYWVLFGVFLPLWNSMSGASSIHMSVSIENRSSCLGSKHLIISLDRLNVSLLIKWEKLFGYYLYISYILKPMLIFVMPILPRSDMLFLTYYLWQFWIIGFFVDFFHCDNFYLKKLMWDIFQLLSVTITKPVHGPSRYPLSHIWTSILLII